MTNDETKKKSKALRIKMNRLVENKFDTDSITEMYHKLFVDMAVHGYESRDSEIAQLEIVIKSADAHIAQLNDKVRRLKIEIGDWKNGSELNETYIRLDDKIIELEKENAELKARIELK